MLLSQTCLSRFAMRHQEINFNYFQTIFLQNTIFSIDILTVSSNDYKKIYIISTVFRNYSIVSQLSSILIKLLQHFLFSCPHCFVLSAISKKHLTSFFLNSFSFRFILVKKREIQSVISLIKFVYYLPTDAQQWSYLPCSYVDSVTYKYKIQIKIVLKIINDSKNSSYTHN